MPRSRSIRAGRAFVEVFADDSKLAAGLRRAQARLNRFAGAVRAAGLKMMGMGAAIVAPMVAAARNFATTGDQIAKMAARTGMGTEALSALGFAAEQSGADLAALENGIRRMQRTLGDAERGSASAALALNRMGVSVDEIVGLAPERQFMLLAQRISQIEDPTRKAALAMEVFGRSGTMLLPLLNQGAEGIAGLMQQAADYGLTIDPADAKRAEQFADSMNLLRRVLRMVVFSVGSAVAHPIKEVVEWLTRAATWARQWAERNRELIVSALKVGAVVLAVGAGLVAFSVAVKVAAIAIGGALAAMKALAAVGAAVLLVVKLLLTPVGLVATAVAALGATILYMTGAAGRAFQWLRQRFASLSEFAGASFRAIADALKSGDFGLAAEIGWLSIRRAFIEGTAEIRRTWAQAWEKIQEIAATAWDSMRAGHEISVNGVTAAMIEAAAWVEKAWAHVGTFFGNLWTRIKEGASQAANHVRGVFDEGFDVEAANRQVSSRAQQEINARTARRNASLAGVDKWRTAMRNEAAAEHNAQMSRITSEHSARMAGIDKQTNASLASIDQQRRDAEEAWRRAISRAPNLTDPKDTDKTGSSPDDFLSRARNMFSGLDDLLDGVGAGRQDPRGTFNAAAIQGLQTTAARAQEMTARHTGQIVRNTRRMNDQLERGPVFR